MQKVIIERKIHCLTPVVKYMKSLHRDGPYGRDDNVDCGRELLLALFHFCAGSISHDSTGGIGCVVHIPSIT